MSAMTAVTMAAPTAATRQLCTFHVGDLVMGVDVLEVQEVIRHQEMTPVPRAPEVVRGLINLRGQIVTAIDLRRRLGLGSVDTDVDDPDAGPLNVVVRTDDGAVSLLVDASGDVVGVAPGSREPPPPTLSAAAASLIAGVVTLEGQLLLVLDTRASATVEAAR